MQKQSKMYHERFLPMLQISQTTLAKFGTNASLLNSGRRHVPGTWHCQTRPLKNAQTVLSPTSKHQKTSDLEVSDDLENLSIPTLWCISNFEEVFFLINTDNLIIK